MSGLTRVRSSTVPETVATYQEMDSSPLEPPAPRNSPHLAPNVVRNSATLSRDVKRILHSSEHKKVRIVEPLETERMPSKSLRRSDTSYTGLVDMDAVKTAIADSRVVPIVKKDEKNAH